MMLNDVSAGWDVTLKNPEFMHPSEKSLQYNNSNHDNNSKIK